MSSGESDRNRDGAGEEGTAPSAEPADANDGADSAASGGATDTETGAGGRNRSAPRREVAIRVFATEYDDATLSYAESDEERAPSYVVTPTGARANRVFIVGVLTDVEAVSDDVLRARIADPTGVFVVYAGQYQPEARAFFEETEPPAFVALTGKARTFEPEDGDRVFTSVRPESVATVDAETRDRWAVRTARRTIERVDTAAEAIATDADPGALREDGLPESLAVGIPRADDHYGTDAAYLRDLRSCARSVCELVAGDRDAVEPVDTAPDAGGAQLADLPTTLSLLGGQPPLDIAGAASEGPSPFDPDGSTTVADGTEESLAPDANGTEGAESSTTGEDPTGAVEPSADGEADAEATAESGPVGTAGASTDGSEATGTDEAEPAATGRDEPPDAVTSDQTPEPSPDPDGGDTFSMDPEERERIEAEHGTDFATGTEVDDPGEADIEVTGAGDAARATAEAAPADADASEPDAVAEAAGSGDEVADADAADDLESAVLDAMRALDDGSGADREAVVERAVDRTGAERDAVADAIQDALMDGECYEPDETTLKPI